MIHAVEHHREISTLGHIFLHAQPHENLHVTARMLSSSVSKYAKTYAAMVLVLPDTAARVN